MLGLFSESIIPGFATKHNATARRADYFELCGIMAVTVVPGCKARSRPFPAICRSWATRSGTISKHSLIVAREVRKSPASLLGADQLLKSVGYAVLVAVRRGGPGRAPPGCKYGFGFTDVRALAQISGLLSGQRWLWCDGGFSP
jgi:hypothetical protein